MEQGQQAPVPRCFPGSGEWKVISAKGPPRLSRKCRLDFLPSSVPISTPCSNSACSWWGPGCLYLCLMPLSVVLQPAATGGVKPQSTGTSNSCPRGSSWSKSSLGRCGQHLIPSEWFSTLRPLREGSRQLNLPATCSTSWLQPAGDSFPQGGCQHLSWGALRLSV